MSFLSYTTLIQRVIVRLRQVSGSAVQTYSEDEIGNLIQEVYCMVRKERWWDQMMTWSTVQLDGVNGLPTTGFAGATDRFEDIKNIYVGDNSTPLPQLTSNVNPYRVNGTYPRFVEPRNMSDDTASPPLLFRIWPLTAVADANRPLRVHYRRDPDNLFTTPSVVVPFDSTCLINGAAGRYLAQDGTNPGGVADMNNAFMTRLDQVRKAHDATVHVLDSRRHTPGLTEWAEERW